MTSLWGMIYDVIHKSGPILDIDPVVDAVIAAVMEEAAKVADAEAIRMRDELHSVLFMHGALRAATAIRDAAREAARCDCE